MRKLVSIAATQSTLNNGLGVETVYGVADDGTFWAYSVARGSVPQTRAPDWRQLPSLPQGGVAESQPPR